MQTLRYTKVFVEGSLLSGMEYDDIITHAPDCFIKWAIRLESTQEVVTARGSNYRIKNVHTSIL